MCWYFFMPVPVKIFILSNLGVFCVRKHVLYLSKAGQRNGKCVFMNYYVNIYYYDRHAIIHELSKLHLRLFNSVEKNFFYLVIFTTNFYDTPL